MAHIPNYFTDMCNLVETQLVGGLKLLSQTIPPRQGFSLELYHNGVYQSSARPGESVSARSGDTVYRVNLGPCSTPVEGVLTTRDGHTRKYGVLVEFQVVDPSAFLQLYLQKSDPVSLLHMSIRNAIQVYAERNDYEEIHATGILDKAKFAFAGTNNLRAGMRINDAHQPYVLINPDYKRVINESPVLTLQGHLKTLDGYRCDYKLTVELEITDQKLYAHMEQQKAEPQKLAQVAIEGGLEQFALQQRYADLSELQLRLAVEQVFNTLPSRVASCMKIVRIHSLALDGTSSISNFWLPLTGQVLTRDGYTRLYEVSVEFQITNQLRYEQLKYEGADPQGMAGKAIEGEIQRYASQQFYEDLTEAGLRTVVEHAFDHLASRLVESIKIVYAPQLSLGEDSTYQPIPQHHLLSISGYLTTREEYVRPYTVTVELQTTDSRRYQQIVSEKSDPLVHAQKSIHHELQSYTRQHRYEDLTEDQLRAVAERALETSPGAVTSVVKVVRAYDFSLSAAPDYLKRPDPLCVNGKIRTSDYRERAYEIVVELEVANAPDFVQARRQGNDYRKLISTAIIGMVQQCTEHKAHDDLSSADLLQATRQTFSQTQNSTIGGMTLVRVLHADVQVDPRIQEEKDTTHEAAIESIRKREQARQKKDEITYDFEAKYLALQKEQELLLSIQTIEEMKNSFALRQKNAEKANEKLISIGERAIDGIGELIDGELGNGRSPMHLLKEAEQTAQLFSLPPASQNNRRSAQSPNHNGQQTEAYVEVSPVEQEVTQSGYSVTSMSRRTKKEIPGWGVHLTECVLNEDQRDFIGVQRAFQVVLITKKISAQNSSLRVADIFTQINGQNVYTLEALEDALASLQPGKHVEVIVLRGNARLEPLTLNSLS